MSSPDPVPRKGNRPKQKNAAAAVAWPIRVGAAWTVCLLILGVGVYVLLRVFEKVSLVAFAVIVALFITSVLHPVERWLRRHLRFKALSSLLVIIGFLVVFGLVGWFVTVQIQDHSSTLGNQLTEVANNIRDYLKNGPLHLKDSDLDRYTSTITNAIREHQGQVVSGAISTAATLLEVLAGVLLCLFTTFFFLSDGDRIWSFVIHLFPAKAQERTDYAGRRGWHTLGGYVRGQVLIAFIHAITIFILLAALRVPLAAALGVIVFLGAFIPILGLTVAGTLCVGVTLLEHGLTRAIIVAIVIIALVQAEGHLFQPIIMSRAVHIHPLAVLLAVAAGTTLYGIVGALISVPLVAFLNSFIRAARGATPQPDAEGETPSDPDPPPPPAPDPGDARPQTA